MELNQVSGISLGGSLKNYEETWKGGAKGTLRGGGRMTRPQLNSNRDGERAHNWSTFIFGGGQASRDRHLVCAQDSNVKSKKNGMKKLEVVTRGSFPRCLIDTRGAEGGRWGSGGLYPSK